MQFEVYASLKLYQNINPKSSIYLLEHNKFLKNNFEIIQLPNESFDMISFMVICTIHNFDVELLFLIHSFDVELDVALVSLDRRGVLRDSHLGSA